MAILQLHQRQIQGDTSSQSLLDQLNNLNKAYQKEIVVSETGANQIIPVGRLYQPGSNQLKVFYNGALQKVGQTYLEIDNSNIQFPDMIYQGDLIVFRIEGAGGGTTFVSDHGHSWNEVLNGTKDGVNKVFYTAKPVRNNEIMVYVNGVLQTLGEDYTITQPATPSPNGSTIVTFVKAPAANDKVLASYTYPIQE
jgi:hypothetical protein